MLNIDNLSAEITENSTAEEQVIEIMSDTARLVDALASSSAHAHYLESRDGLKAQMRIHFTSHPEDSDYLPNHPTDKNTVRNWAIAARQELAHEVQLELEAEKRDQILYELIGQKAIQVTEKTGTIFDKEYSGRVEKVSSLLGNLTLRTIDNESVTIDVLPNDPKPGEDPYEPIVSLKFIDD